MYVCVRRDQECRYLTCVHTVGPAALRRRCTDLVQGPLCMHIPIFRWKVYISRSRLFLLLSFYSFVLVNAFILFSQFNVCRCYCNCMLTGLHP